MPVYIGAAKRCDMYDVYAEDVSQSKIGVKFENGSFSWTRKLGL